MNPPSSDRKLRRRKVSSTKFPNSEGLLVVTLTWPARWVVKHTRLQSGTRNAKLLFSRLPMKPCLISTDAPDVTNMFATWIGMKRQEACVLKMLLKPPRKLELRSLKQRKIKFGPVRKTSNKLAVLWKFSKRFAQHVAKPLALENSAIIAERH